MTKFILLTLGRNDSRQTFLDLNSKCDEYILLQENSKTEVKYLPANKHSSEECLPPSSCGNPWLKKVFYLFLCPHMCIYMCVCIYIYTCLKFYLPPASMFNKIILVLSHTAYPAGLESLN